MQVSTYSYNTANQLASVDLDGRTIASYTYDGIGRTTTVTDQDSVTLTYTYDNLDRVTKITYPDGTFEQVAYHGITGMKDWTQARDGGRTLYFYDQRGYLIATNEPGQRFTFWNYDNDGNLILLIDPQGNRTTWQYDIEGRLIQKTLQDGALEQYAWNTKSQLTQQTSPRGMQTIFTYDTLGRLTSTAYQTSAGATAFPTESRTYDVLDRVATSVDGEGTTTYSFDTAARLSSVDGPYSNDAVSYGYDALSRVNSITTPGSITQSYTYDSDKRLSTWTDVFGSGSMTYDGRTSRVTNVSRASGVLSTSYAYSAASDLFKLSQIKHQTGGSAVSQFDYTWNTRQDIATWTRTLGTTADRQTQWTLVHDAAHQLISATLQQVSSSAVVADQRWNFDAIGNRTLDYDLVANVRNEYTHNGTNQRVNQSTYSSGQRPWVKGAISEPGSVNLGGSPLAVKGDNSFQGQAPSRATTVVAQDTAGNTTSTNWQLISGTGSTPDVTLTYSYDSEGNFLGDGTSTFEWDLRNRLTAIVTGTHRTEFTYDGSDRRVRVVEKDSGSVTSDKRYVFNGLSLLEERASDNSTALRRFYAGGHVDLSDSGKRYAYTTDHLGSVREAMLLDGTSGDPTTATLTARYDYDLWGKRTVLDGGTAAETLVLRGYTGHVYHKQSGLWLATYRAYSSTMGRWISRDPIGERGGINLYGYVGNAPVLVTDPLGLCGEEDSRPWIDRVLSNLFGDRFSNKPELTAENAAKELGRDRDDALKAAQTGLDVARTGMEMATPSGEEMLAAAAVAALIRRAARVPIWSSTRNKTSVENAYSHWQKHGGEFPEYQNAKQYADGAKNFFSNPPPGTLSKSRPYGEKVFYNPSNNTFGVQGADGAPKTMFRPDPAQHGYPSNFDYYNAQ